MKPKVYFISFLILLSVSVAVNAQENSKKSLFCISTGYASFNHAKQGGISFSNEYIRNVSRYFTYGARYMFAAGTGTVEGLPPGYNTHISTSALDMNGFLRPFKSEKDILLLGLGITLDYTVTSQLSGSDYLSNNDKTYAIADTEASISLLEPVFSLHYYHCPAGKFFFGMNLNARDWNLYEYMVQLGGGVKF